MTPNSATTALQRIALLASDGSDLTEVAPMLVARLVALRHRPYCLAPRFSAEAARALTELGAEVVPIDIPVSGLNPFAEFSARRAAVATLKAIKPHAVMAYDLAAAGGLAAPATRAGATRIVAALPTTCVRAVAGGIDLTAPDERLLRQLMASATSLLVPSMADQRLLRGLDFSGDVAIDVVPSTGVDLADVARVRLPSLADGIQFVSYAPVLTLPLLTELASAMKPISGRSPVARLRLIGRLPQGTDSNKAAALLADCAGFMTYDPSATIAEAVAAAHVYVHAASSPGLTRGLLTALAIGRPLIVSDVDAARETVDQVANGYLVKPSDPAGLAETMLTISRRADLLPAMAEASRQKAERRFDATTIAATQLAALGLPPALDSVA